MAFTRSTITTSIIRALADQPTETAAQLKTKFDEYAENDKTFTNDTLIAELEKTTAGSSAAENLGSAAIAGVSGTTVRAQIVDLKSQVDTNNTASVKLTGDQTVAGIKTFSSSPIVPTPTTSTQVATKGYIDTVASNFVLGAVPDNSITNAKIATASKIGLLADLDTAEKGSIVGAINELAAAPSGSSDSLIDANDVYLISPVATVTDAVNYVEVSNAATGDAPGFSAKGTDTDIDFTISAKGAGSAKTLTQPLSATCLRNVTISTSDPSGGTDGDIWIKYTP